MKRIMSAFLAMIMIASAISFTVFAKENNEPTTEELEAVIKLVKPKLPVPEQCKEFSWRFNAKTAYSDATWRLTWETDDEAKTYERVLVTCDTEGNIISYTYRNYDKSYGQLPSYTKAELEAVANEFLKTTVPEVFENVKLHGSYGTGIYSGQYTYVYSRYIDGYLFPDNYVNIAVDYNTGDVTQMNVEYDYELEIDKHESIITPEKAEEILGTKQEMVLTYLTKTNVDKETKERTIKAFLVYKPKYSYLAVDAGTGELYDTKSSWEVNDSVQTEGAAGAPALKNDAMTDESAREDYELSEEELAGVKELEGLISKEEAIKAVTQNKYLYINPALTAVEAQLSKNYSVEKTASYQNDDGSYIWYIYFSNPVIDDKYYDYAYANASVNAQTGEIISYSCNLNDYYYYSKNNIDVPEVKYDAEASRAIAKEFLEKHAQDKFENVVESSYNSTNIIKLDEKSNAELYGAHRFNFTRVNEGIKFSRNYINVGVDGVTGKVYNYNYNWWTNVEFESPKGAMTPEQALSALLEKDGYGVIYERNMTYIYNPVTDSSKKDICVAFVASLAATVEFGGDVDAVINKYAKNIDKEKLMEIVKAQDEKALLDFVCAHFGISADGIEEDVYEYIDSALFYDREATARLVYTCYDMGSTYISPFTGKQLMSNGEEYIESVNEFTYSDLSGHWIEKDATLLADVGIGFEGGKFLPDKEITVEEFDKLASNIGFYMGSNDETADDTVTRIDAIKTMVDSFGFGKVAQIKGIYKTDFADNGEIKEEDIGYVAIANGLGIIKGDGNNVNAYDTLTRAQAVTILINGLKTMR